MSAGGLPLKPANRWALTERRWLRLAAFTAFYFAQGVPIGLISIALPAWLAERGVTLAEIAIYHAVVGLPWGFKLISGPFMDRFRFPAMGRRRPWVVGAQGGLTLALATLALVSDPRGMLAHLVALAFVVNVFAALQDVAVDGMAIDVLPESERGRANAFMAFGQVAGFSAFAAIEGFLLSHFGLPLAALAAAATVGLVFALAAMVRERPGERLMPWSPGCAAAGAPPETSFFEVFGRLARVLLLPAGLILVAAEWIARMRDGVAISVIPVMATQVLGYSTEQYTSLQGLMGIAVALLGLAVGPLVDRYGAKTFYLIGVAGSGLVSFAFALTTPLWSVTAYVVVMWVVMSFFGQVIFVSFIAAAMAICWAPVAASQFAIYMSLSNLARSAGSAAFAPVANGLSPEQQLLLMSALMAAAFVVVLFFRIEPHRRSLEALDDSRRNR